MNDQDYQDDMGEETRERHSHSGGDRRSRSHDQRDRFGGGGGRRRRRRREDYFATNRTVPNYKEVDTLRRFITDRAKIRPRRQTGLSAKNQRRLAQAIKRARHLALLPFTDEHMRGGG